ncbi:3-phenylpropionate/cinnamic acid dioxygenase ferredoxin subunit [Acaryochloris thomasi RCC1774]|uniref:3-phenylpropionate/cinnamic acid dioxygenase ferredoxin subunit n=1 Tax=Acaryochloris thomasi RCC1774 TaxID=1764569 RepID=A0A2W1JTI2_9CYAN|nr:Rieske 2Fe-2S domain-containing protein [Acaryochloris thomasi]PZD73164.1 3-phenylpropionate/cinnamic acid dioxygenase ferredoxin subunit [Acaryochloris thomasi RCC1774]
MNKVNVPHKHMVQVAQVSDVQADGVMVVHAEGHAMVSDRPSAIALFHHQGQIYAVDNRCPYMGFPLQKGSVKNCVLTCHWHHARFDLTSGGTFDIWADDGRAFPVEVREGRVWVDLTPHTKAKTYQHQRLVDGLEQGLSLVIAKSVIAQLAADEGPTAAFQTGLDFGVRYRRQGWGTGLTIHTCMMQLRPHLHTDDRPRALYHGLSAVARDCAGEPPRFAIQPLPSTPVDFQLLKGWFRQFIEVRDAQGAERCLASAIQAGVETTQLADMLFSSVTDHRFIDGGHALDFTNKALEALDQVQGENIEGILTSLVRSYAQAERMEESNAWRYPIDLVAILERAFETLPDAISAGNAKRESQENSNASVEQLIPVLLGDDPDAIASGLLNALRQGCTADDLAGVVAYAAALRIAKFQTNNDFRDWDTAHHTFTFANAVHQGLKRVTSGELLRGVFDAAMAVYLNRFLNVPPARLPDPTKRVEAPAKLLDELPDYLDRQQQVNAAGNLVGTYLYSGGDPTALLTGLGRLLLREDRDFHTIQNLEAAVQQYQHWQNHEAGIHVLVATARYLAAHAPTMRAQGQTYEIAARLHKGDRMYEED